MVTHLWFDHGWVYTLGIYIYVKALHLGPPHVCLCGIVAFLMHTPSRVLNLEEVGGSL